MVKVATIAGSDASGGAGLEADLKTFEEYGVYGMAAVTLAATMDPLNNWSHNIFPFDERALKAQLETIFNGVGVAAAKSGMLGSFFAVSLTREYVKKYGVKHYVLDPVMVCKGAGEALNPELNAALEKELLPLAEVVTPNIFEAEQLSRIAGIDSVDKMKEAAKVIHEKGAKNVFVKGGAKLGGDAAIDIFFDGASFYELKEPLIKTAWTHGAGCTTAAAITASLAKGASPKEAVESAKRFITGSLAHGFALNRWVGPGNPSSWRNDKVFS